MTNTKLLNDSRGRFTAPRASAGIVALLFALFCAGAVVADDAEYAADQQEPIETEAVEKSTVSFSCNTNSSKIAYCNYVGPVRQVYANNTRLLLIYPDSQVSGAEIQAAVEGIGYESYWGEDVSQFGAFAVRTPAKNLETSDPGQFHDRSDFVEKAYASALAAQVAARTVTIQLRGVESGYLEIDRLWFQ